MKSHESNLLDVALCIYKDACAKCAADPQFRDLEVMRSRVEDEGLSFLTITLPNLGKDLDRSLAEGQIAPEYFRAFKKYGRIPAFLRGIFECVFDKRTGGILDDFKIEAIEGLRQIAYAFKKLEVSCTPKRVRLAIEGFRQDELVFEQKPSPSELDDFVNLSDCLWTHVLVGGGCQTSPQALIPKHGPGATEEKINSQNGKYLFRRWHERLEPYFPMLHFAFPNENAHGSAEFESLALVSEEQEAPVRVIPVPKTLKAPRIIAIEPVCMQYTQQAISQELVRVLESSELTRGHVNFTDQKVNQMLAMTASADAKFATLDLSSASDRVPYSIAIRMFDCLPDLRDAISACRSTKAKLPEGDIISLKKFASMGSALCFPVEAMYFFTICIMALLKKQALPVTYRNIRKVARYVYVYGDDIIVPTDAAAIVIDHLHKYHCKVNTSKSFWTGKFRESCGVDAYAGQVVTPTYLKQCCPNNKRETTQLISWVKASNAFYKKGYWLTSSHLVKKVEAILGALPIMGPEAAGLGKVSFQHVASIERWGKRFQRPEVRAWTAVPVYLQDRLEGYSALTKCLLSLEVSKLGETLTAKDHLVRTARYGAVTLKRRWISPY